MFPANDPSKVVLVLDVFPMIPPGLGTQTFFDPGVLYQFKPDSVGSNQKLTMYGPARPASAGTRTSIVTGSRTGAIPYNAVTDLGQGIMAFAGPREDPFYFDLARFGKIQPDRDFSKQPEPAAEQRALLPQGRQGLPRRL